MVGRMLGCGGMIRDMHGACMSGFSKYIKECNATKAEL